MMEKLVVFDYNDNSVSIWDVEPGTMIDDEYITSLGFHLSEVSWMVCSGLSVHFHKRVLQ